MDDEYMLTTYDNPFNPFTDFETWWKMDMALGHDCCGTLAREANTSPLFSDEQNEMYIDRAIERLVQMEPTLYRRVHKKDYAFARA